VQLGYLFDLEGAPGRPAAHLVLSLLAESDLFARGIEALVGELAR
jgi:hypothetical protein